jgi:hypothetical protein
MAGMVSMWEHGRVTWATLGRSVNVIPGALLASTGDGSHEVFKQKSR